VTGGRELNKFDLGDGDIVPNNAVEKYLTAVDAFVGAGAVL
jgi:hypothetical protein